MRIKTFLLWWQCAKRGRERNRFAERKFFYPSSIFFVFSFSSLKWGPASQMSENSAAVTSAHVSKHICECVRKEEVEGKGKNSSWLLIKLNTKKCFVAYSSKIFEVPLIRRENHLKNIIWGIYFRTEKSELCSEVLVRRQANNRKKCIRKKMSL